MTKLLSSKRSSFVLLIVERNLLLLGFFVAEFKIELAGVVSFKKEMSETVGSEDTPYNFSLSYLLRLKDILWAPSRLL